MDFVYVNILHCSIVFVTVDMRLLLFTERYSDLSIAAQVLSDTSKKKDNERY